MNTLDSNQISNLKKRYRDFHPLVFHRSMERSRNLLELFDILESIPIKGPFSWDDEKRVWSKETDILFQKKLKV